MVKIAGGGASQPRGAGQAQRRCRGRGHGTEGGDPLRVETPAFAKGAREAGTAFLGAAYGYGAPGELTGEGSLGEAASPDGLRSYLFL